MLKTHEERRLYLLRDDGKLDPRDYPDIKDEIQDAREVGATDKKNEQEAYDHANSSRKTARKRRNLAVSA